MLFNFIFYKIIELLPVLFFFLNSVQFFCYMFDPSFILTLYPTLPLTLSPPFYTAFSFDLLLEIVCAYCRHVVELEPSRTRRFLGVGGRSWSSMCIMVPYYIVLFFVLFYIYFYFFLTIVLFFVPIIAFIFFMFVKYLFPFLRKFPAEH